MTEVRTRRDEERDDYQVYSQTKYAVGSDWLSDEREELAILLGISQVYEEAKKRQRESQA